MNWEKFKYRFRKDAQQEKLEVDAAAIWDAIEADVDAINNKKSKRRGFIFWFFLAGLLAIGTGTFLYLLNEDNTPALSQNQNAISQPSDLTKKNPNSNREQYANLSSKNDDDASNTEALISKPGASNQGRNNSTESKQEINTTRKFKTNPDLNRPRNISTNQNKAELKENQENQDQTSIIAPITKNTANNKDKSLPEVSNEPKQSISTSDSNRPLLPSKTKYSSNTIPRLSFSLDSKTKEVSLREKLDQLILEEESSEELLSDQDQLTTNKNWTVLVSPYVGVNAVNRSLTKEIDPEGNLINVRNRYETPLEAINYGLSLGLEHQSGFRLSAGIRLSNIAERFDFNETTIMEDSIMGIQAIAVNPLGDTFAIEGLIPRTTITENEIQIYNSYRLIDIPVTIDYHRQLNEKWRLGLEAGIFANISLKTEGSVFNEELVELNLESNQDEIFKSKIGLSYHLGLSLEHNISERLGLSFAPSFRFIPESIAIDNYGLSQKYSLFGANLRLHYRF